MSMASQSSRPSLRGPHVDADFDLPALGAALWRQRYQILRPAILVALLTFVVVILIPPKYQSESRVLVVGRDNVFLRPDADKDIIDRGIVDQEAVTSQAQIVLSREVANEVIAKLKLADVPEFDPALGGVSLIKSILGFLGIIKNPLSMTPEERVLAAYYERLTVFPVEKSRVIVIDFLSENPELAARVANAVADAYLQHQQLAKQDQARSAGQYLSGELDSMRKKVADAEAKVEAFRAKSNLLVGPNGTTLSAQQLGDLNGQLATARAQKADAEAKARLIREMLKSGAEIDSSDILNSELIRRLSEQRVTLARAARRAIVFAARPASAHQGTEGADRRSRQPDPARGRDHRALAGKRLQACRRPRRGAAHDLRPVQEPGGQHQRAGCAVARARARGQVAARSAWNRISANIVRRAPATPSAPRRPMPALFPAPWSRTCRPIRRSCRPC